MSHTINVLWTGGWDSTFRVIHASLLERKCVIPHYIVDTKRRSSLHELKAIANVRKALEHVDPEAADRIGALMITPITEIPEDEEVSRAYRQMRSRNYLGNQYVWLAAYARSKGLNGLELSVHVDDKAYNFLEGKVTDIANGGWVLRDDVAGNEKALFSRFHFPLLDHSKMQMQNLAQQHGFLDVLEHAWFCYHPIFGKPCGICNPCCYTLEEGMGYRLPTVAKLRHQLRFLYTAWRGSAVLVRRARTLRRHA